MSEIGERVKKIVVEHLGVEPEKVVDNASFIDDLGADSLDTVAAYVGMLRLDFTVESPPELVPLLEAIADRYRRAAAGS